jgi:hypothetical protein
MARANIPAKTARNEDPGNMVAMFAPAAGGVNDQADVPSAANEPQVGGSSQFRSAYNRFRAQSWISARQGRGRVGDQARLLVN